MGGLRQNTSRGLIHHGTFVINFQVWLMTSQLVYKIIEIRTNQSQNAKRASSQKRHMVISIFLLCNSLILMSIGAGSIRAIKGGLDKVFKIWDRHHRIRRQILR